jgi:hypothetical protein
VRLHRPVETLLKCTAPSKSAGRRSTSRACTRSSATTATIRDEVKVEGDNLDGMTIGIGIRDLPNGKWIEKSDPGYAISAGDSNQPESGYTSSPSPRSSQDRLRAHHRMQDPKAPSPASATPGMCTSSSPSARQRA